jgi:hypothetical protein
LRTKSLSLNKEHSSELSDFIIGFIHLLYCPSFFVVKPITPINMKSNVCNSLNYFAQYIGVMIDNKRFVFVLYCQGGQNI